LFSLGQKGKERVALEGQILIVDDDEQLTCLIARRLNQEGHTCVTASSGKDAIYQFHQDTFSLIILDIRMPEMDGLELLKRVKAFDPAVMVVMMTGYPEIDVAVEALRLGAHDLIIKPFDLESMVRRVENALEKKKLQEQIDSYSNHLDKLVEGSTAKLHRSLHALKKAHLESLQVLIGAIETKDPYTRGHSDRVKNMSVKIGRSLGFDASRLEALEFGALLHDIGMLGVDNEILRKTVPLTFEEHQAIRKHPIIGAKIVDGIDFFKDKIPIIRHHHEHFDGSGYPGGLTGEAIPLEARMVLISDAFDAMSSSRPYRENLTLRAAFGELEKGSGKQFDPIIVEIFLNQKIYLNCILKNKP
jgi:putative two-component system response regulator